ncbi:hypothetical protein MATL_G00022930 [Megalops atlanticus]|uniref:Apolipoprotein D n=1 Tax=Megalops atlanticus TaxID=7932 RepID=A0A9D3QCD5_MEGAT|nr:hypothetical protein MATL_G00022930 [Megalops atlanticus]
MKASFALLLPLLLPLVSGQVFHWGSCPDATVQPSFELQKYLGKWYEIARLPNIWQRGDCAEANYSMRADESIKVVNTELMNGKPNTVEGTAVVQDFNEPAKLGVSCSYFSPYSPYWVLYTDYETVAAVYSCTGVMGIFHVDYAWIIGRSRWIPEEAVSSAKNAFISNGIDLSKMTVSDQQGCDMQL